VSAVPLPKDAVLVELRPESLTFQTRECLLPRTPVAFRLVMEGRSLPLTVAVEACLVVDRDRAGHLFHTRMSLASLSEGDRSLVAMFIAKGRGAPAVAGPEEAR